MNRVEVNERAFDLKSAITGRESFRGSRRRVFTLTVVNTSYEDINEIYKTEYGVNVSSSEMAQVWECFQDYDNTVYPDITPDNPSWRTFNRPLHGTSPETAMPWAKPTNATDQYNIGEYMVYIDNIVYKCIQSTNFSPEEYGEAWEKQVFD